MVQLDSDLNQGFSNFLGLQNLLVKKKILETYSRGKALIIKTWLCFSELTPWRLKSLDLNHSCTWYWTTVPSKHIQDIIIINCEIVLLQLHLLLNHGHLTNNTDACFSRPILPTNYMWLFLKSFKHSKQIILLRFLMSIPGELNKSC